MNPYYIPPGPAPLTGLANNILALSELRQRGQIAEQNQLNEAEQLAQGRERNEILRLDAENKQKQWERENPHLQNYGGNQHVELVTTFKRLGLPNSEFVKESERMTQNPETTRGQAYLRIRGMKGVLQKEIQDELIKKADDPTFTGSEREQTLKTILDCIGQEGGYDALIDEAFPDVSQIYRAEEAKQAEETAKQKRQERPYKVGQMVTKKGQGGREFQGTVQGYDDNNQPVIQWQDVTKPDKPEKVKEEKPAFTPLQIATAEKQILNSKEDQDITSQMSIFNENSNKPYSYQMVTTKTARYVGNVRIPGTGGEETKLKKIKLPVVNGKQVTAKDVADTANARGMTYDEALNAILTLSKGRK